MRLTNAGRLFTYWPSRKNVAFASYFFSVSSSVPAYLPGPSSNVSARHLTCSQSTGAAFFGACAKAGAGARVTQTAAIARSELICRDIGNASNEVGVARDVPTVADQLLAGEGAS